MCVLHVKFRSSSQTKNLQRTKYAPTSRCNESSDIKIDKTVNPFKVVAQIDKYLKQFMEQKNTNFIAETNINLRTICFRIRILIMSKPVCHIKF